MQTQILLISNPQIQNANTNTFNFKSSNTKCKHKYYLNAI